VQNTDDYKDLFIDKLVEGKGGIRVDFDKKHGLVKRIESTDLQGKSTFSIELQ
jgi:hypothetical protein